MTEPIWCELQLPSHVTAGEGVTLSLRLSNPGSVAAAFLVWGTPFEGMWTGPSVTIERDGSPLEYRGPMVKRGAPAAEEYLRIPAGGHVDAELPLHEAFDLTVPGRYRIVPRFVLADVVRGGEKSPRPFEAMREEPLRCAEGLLEVIQRR